MTGFPQRVKELILARSSGMCEVMIDNLCTYTASQMHHRRPRARGGSKRSDTNTAANALHVCLACHNWAEMHRERALESGWLIPNNRVPMVDPASVRVLWRKQWRYLDTDGGMHQQPPASEVA